MTENNYRILAIDDHPIVLQGIQALATELHNVSCTTKTDIRLEDLPEDSVFDLCILDLGLCGKQSGDFIARLRTRMPSCRILVYTMHEEPWIADELVGLDVEGAVSKNSPLDELQQAISHLRCGLSYYDPVFTRLMRPKALNRLTLKEAQVLKHIMNGLSNAQIAQAMSLSINTVKTHRRRIMKKFEVYNVTQLVGKISQ